MNDPKESFYWQRMTKAQGHKSKVKDILYNPWPLSETLPDMVYTLTITTKSRYDNK